MTHSHNKRLGFLSDSHGEFEIVERAVHILRREGADCIIHLGDFLDSARTHSRERIVNFLRENNIRAVKGNNEVQIESTLQSEGQGPRPELADYLQHLSAETIMEDLCFVHNMPARYQVSLYEPIDVGNTDKALPILIDTSHWIIFSGHSHTPVIFELAGGKATRQVILPGSRNLLRPAARYIIVVGSSDSGTCGLFDREQMLYRSIRIE